MKTKEIAKAYRIDQMKFEKYLRSVGAGKSGIMGMTLEDNIEKHIEAYKEYCKEEEIKIQQAQREEEKKQQELASMLITSGFNFDGYKIKKYSGYISGDDAVSIPRGTAGIFSSATNVNKKLTESLVKIRRQAIKELKEAAYDLGCNAVIGVDFDYITLEPETATSSGGTQYLPYVFCVTANGNAVIIEKEE